jgi:hypothetical protein
MAAFDPQGRPVKRKRTTPLKSGLQYELKLQEDAMIKQEGENTGTSVIQHRRLSCGLRALTASSQTLPKPAIMQQKSVAAPAGVPRFDRNFIPQTSSNPFLLSDGLLATVSPQFQNGMNKGENLMQNNSCNA